VQKGIKGYNKFVESVIIPHVPRFKGQQRYPKSRDSNIDTTIDDLHASEEHTTEKPTENGLKYIKDELGFQYGKHVPPPEHADQVYQFHQNMVQFKEQNAHHKGDALDFRDGIHQYFYNFSIFFLSFF
jgi:hypothetical protein